ncbi:VOC family protein [Altererythrobacter arenosus]|uniref:VOC family protein n=1 Tax=Altererythrobacter arenosus TaxID=3032592 RepID=A0ABY8FMV9_9SPHN|nr:VOC family protein [Altererythrobacter sp. CAU 1644]WFL76187.1 VOC family protein [Altererythrobacter sp. CAU 1644]
MSGLRFSMMALVVPDYDQGIAYYHGALGFTLVEDTDMGGGKRWVVVDPGSGARLLLAKASNDRQSASIGNQTGGRVGFFLETENFAATHARFIAQGVTFEEAPRSEPYGMVAVFSDPFGNRWDLIETRNAA